MNHDIQRIYDRLLEELEVFAGLGAPPVNKALGALRCIRESLELLRNYIQDHPFRTAAEEIAFFKEVKPKFIAEQVYLNELVSIQMNRPGYDAAQVKAFLGQELALLRHFFFRYRTLYQYYQLGASDMDDLLFLRGVAMPSCLMPDQADQDPAFSTNGDYLFGKFVALERLQQWLMDELFGEDTQYVSSAGRHQGQYSRDIKELKWTGETINLVELGYGIWLTGQLNHGNAGIAEIISWLENCFSVKLGRPHRRWQSIAQRKRIAVTRFTDEVKKAILKRLEDELGR